MPFSKISQTKTATIQEAQENLNSLLELVHAGTEVVLTDGHQALARLTPPRPLSTPSFSFDGLEPLPEGFWCN